MYKTFSESKVFSLQISTKTTQQVFSYKGLLNSMWVPRIRQTAVSTENVDLCKLSTFFCDLSFDELVFVELF